MIIGSLGDIIFEVSNSTIRTVRDLKWSGSARISEHKRHLQKSLVEFCGTDPDGFTFNLRLSKHLGVEPMTDIEKLVGYEKNGAAVLLILGTKKYGEYRWLVEKHKKTMEYFDKSGNLTSVDVSVTLKEYVKE